jgi:hypothetical protein
VPKAISMPVEHSSQTDRNELLLDPCHLGVPLGVSKMIFKPMVRLAQTMHLSCVEINTISKHTEPIFHLIYPTWEYHLLCQSDFRAYGTFGENYAPILPRD